MGLTVPPTCEPLEARKLFAAVSFHHHTLTVTGSDASSNQVTVGLAPGGTAIVATVTYATGQGTNLTPHTVSKSFPISAGISRVHITGGGQGDAITIDQTNGSFPVPCTMTGGAGDDTITGGDEPDYMNGGAGADLLSGGAGNDTLIGAAGSDTLLGGLGNDSLAGQGGHDDEEGGDGNDTITDAAGPDTVMGGAGNNTFNIHSLKRENADDYVKAKDVLHLIAAPARFSSTDDSTGVLGTLFPILGL